MKKTYLKPEMISMLMATERHLLAGSGEGVNSGSNVGNVYNGQDVTYSKGSGFSIWSDDTDEE